MRKLIFLAALLLPSVAMAQQWEYRVVYLDVPLDGTKVRKDAIQQVDGHYTNVEINAMLNALGKDGWEVVSVTGNNISQTAFLKRAIKTPE